jgi:plastocyanin
MSRRRVPLVALLALPALLALACGLSAASVARAGTHHEIVMRGNSFSPRALTITVGDTIVWRNADIVRHNATRPELFESGDLRGGESFRWVAADTGAVRYRCTIHQRMRGEVMVVARP